MFVYIGGILSEGDFVLQDFRRIPSGGDFVRGNYVRGDFVQEGLCPGFKTHERVENLARGSTPLIPPSTRTQMPMT